MPVEADLTVRGVAHDLNNVFQTILESAHLLSSDPKWSSIAAILKRSAMRGRRIVQGLCEDAPCSVALEQVISEASEFAGDALRALHIPGVGFRCQIEPGLLLHGAPMAWERVFLNLFINAGEAMPNGGVVDVQARRLGDRIEILVSDSGSGILPEDLTEIFKPHFSRKPSGSGLGLHVVDLIVRQHGGSVAATNRSGAPGSTFRIAVPA